jgi:hypothetical protein
MAMRSPTLPRVNGLSLLNAVIHFESVSQNPVEIIDREGRT